MAPEAAGGRVRIAPAKINLALHVTGRRPDGYHALDTLAVFASEGDRLAVGPAGDRLALTVEGPFSALAPAGEDNLVIRAARSLAAALGRPAEAAIRLEKNLPAGAGFGGGSADAAAALLALNDLWAAALPGEELAALALGLGADVPMCLAGRALRARGVGERLAALGSWPALPVVLVWPGRTVA
ncbi:4-(cytidine 5'-diphospho)-2-C-methyl-D-erythritol kinase, partial [Propylenella binzhouense]